MLYKNIGSKLQRNRKNIIILPDTSLIPIIQYSKCIILYILPPPPTHSLVCSRATVALNDCTWYICLKTLYWKQLCSRDINSLAKERTLQKVLLETIVFSVLCSIFMTHFHILFNSVLVYSIINYSALLCVIFNYVCSVLVFLYIEYV